MTHDHPFEARVRRLSVVSLIALGVLTWLTIRDDASPVVVGLLVAGWILMPVLLRLSLRTPALRYVLTMPATLVGGGLTWFCLTGLPASDLAATGWWTITASIWLGALLGMWLWFRWMPVPPLLDDPFGPARVTLVAVHIGGMLIGIAMVLG